MLDRLDRLRKRLAERTNKYVYRVWGGPRGHGRPKPKESWDAEYARGKWAYMNSLAELSRYAVLAGFIHFMPKPARVLELGCGDGALARTLSKDRIASFLGVDISSEAIRQATGNSDSSYRFIAADIERWQPDGKFDVILFNEVLYYLRDPLETAERYVPWLEQGGRFMVCMVEHEFNASIWKKLETRFDTLHKVSVADQPGATNQIRIIVPNSIDS